MKAVLDTSYILGRGAVQDTYNLLAEGIKKLIWALARRLERVKPQRWAEAHGSGRYFASSLKGQAAMADDKCIASVLCDCGAVQESAQGSNKAFRSACCPYSCRHRYQHP
jgi:hypothetical protein